MNENFKYSECLICGCLQLHDIPDDFSKYYGSGYYSMKVPNPNRIKKLLKKIRFDYAMGGKSFLGKILTLKYGTPPMVYWLKELDISFDDKILDVGCGYGHLLLDMYDLGFKNLTGLDLFIDKDIHYKPSLKIFKKSISELEGEFDLIMFHHSFEHMFNIVQVLQDIKSKLKTGKTLLIRIPLADSTAWKKYGINWVNLDAPRHIFLHTRKSMSRLAEITGFRISKIKYDSNSFQFWASEQYMKGIPLLAENSYAVSPGRSIFSKKEIEDFEAEARRLNHLGLGDQACFYMTH